MSDTPVMKRCKKCQEWKPATPEYFWSEKKNSDGLMGKCKVCTQLHKHDYNERNADKLSNYFRDRYQRKRDELLEKKREYYKQNRKEIRVRQREYESRNVEKVRAQQYNWKSRNAEKVSQYKRRWKSRNPEKLKAIIHNYRSRKRNAPGKIEAWWWKRCLDYFGHRCAVCGRSRGFWHTLSPDHWHIPVSQGGPNTPDNIVPLCFALKDGTGGCNNSKKNLNSIEWVRKTLPKKEADAILARIEDYFAWIKQQDG